MSLELKIRKAGKVTIVDVSGRVTLGGAATTLSDNLRQLAARGDKEILLNLGGLSTIDSSGLGALVSSCASITGAGGHLKLLNLTDRVKNLLLLTKLYTVFEVFEDEGLAVSSFFSEGATATAIAK
jgi:anti-sigma B factor antagonist